MDSDLTKLKDLLQSSSKKNKILTNVVILIIDSFPDKKQEIADVIYEEMKKGETPFITDFLETLYNHSDDYKTILNEKSESGDEKTDDEKVENEIVENERIENEKIDNKKTENGNDKFKDLPIPPELVFFSGKKEDSKFKEFLQQIGPEIENKIENAKKNIFGKTSRDIIDKSEPSKRVKHAENEQEQPIIKRSIFQEKKTPTQQTPKEPNQKIEKKQKNLFDILFSSLQCRICGLRFHSENMDTIEQLYVEHMEQHQKKSKTADENRFRPFFVDENGWLNEKSRKIIFDFDVTSIKKEMDKNNNLSDASVTTQKILVKKKLVHCALCKNKMNVVWDDEDDSWSIKDGVKLGDEYVHKECAF